MSVAVVGPDGGVVYDGDEADLLTRLDRDLARLPPGVLVTWNGARFDLPFIADRARLHRLALGLRLRLDSVLPAGRDPLPGHDGGYRASWHDHRHLDAYVLYRGDVGASLGLSCGLKPLSRMLGLNPVEVDRTAIHELSPEQLRAYVLSDASLTRELAARRWPTAVRAIDPTPPDQANPSRTAPTTATPR